MTPDPVALAKELYGAGIDHFTGIWEGLSVDEHDRYIKMARHILAREARLREALKKIYHMDFEQIGRLTIKDYEDLINRMQKVALEVLREASPDA